MPPVLNSTEDGICVGACRRATGKRLRELWSRVEHIGGSNSERFSAITPPGLFHTPLVGMFKISAQLGQTPSQLLPFKVSVLC